MDANPYSTPAQENPSRSGPTRTIVRINPVQFGKILGVLYALGSLIFLPFIMLFMAFAPKGAGAPAAAVGMGMLIFIPIFYGIVGLIGGVIVAWIYNICAKLVGGIEVEVE